MAFGGPCAGAWLPFNGSTIAFAFVPEEVDDETLDALAFGPAARAVDFRRSEHRYDLARFAFRDWRDDSDSTFVCWVHHPERDELVEEVARSLKFVAWLAGYRPLRPYLPDLADLFE